MVVYQNVLSHYRDEILRSITFDNIVDKLISQKVLDENLYRAIWTKNKDVSQNFLFTQIYVTNVILARHERFV